MALPPIPPVLVALVEDHQATRAALEAEIRAAPQLKLVRAVGSAEELLKGLTATPFHVALVDLHLPGLSGAELIQQVGTQLPEVRCVALSSFDDEERVIEAVRSGAYGYLLKDEPHARLVQAVTEAAAGEHPVSSRVAGFLFTQARRAPAPVALSDREEELARALAEGDSYAECAQRMGIALGTVQDYVKRLYRKLDVNSKKEVRAWVAMYVSNR